MASSTPGVPSRSRVRSAAELGELVHRRRKSLRLTQVEVAGLAGVGDRFLRELEHGKPTLHVGKVLRVLNRLGLEAWIEPRSGRNPRP